MIAHSRRRQITLLELAAYRLGRDARTEADFDEAGVPILGGCETCGAIVAAYNAQLSRSGCIRCAECIGEHGWSDVALAEHEHLRPRQQRLTGRATPGHRWRQR